MKIAILLYDKFTALDAVGPYEILSRLPGAELCFVGLEKGPVRSDTGRLAITADASLDETPSAELLLIPGGPGDEAACAEQRILDWVQRIHEGSKWTASVCTGALILAAAGILDGVQATTHWARYARLEELGAKAKAERVVRQGKIITAAGVSAGIDMALELAAAECGEDVAKMLQLGIEYDPHPPFDCGSPDKAPAALAEMVRASMRANRA